MLTSGFFNSINGDRRYNAAQISGYFKGILTNGIYQNIGSAFEVAAGNDLTIQVLDGRAYIDGCWAENDAFYNITIPTPSASYSRIDTIVLRLDMTNRNIVLDVLEGIPAPTPTAEALTRNSTIKEYALAYVTVPANATQITNANITDKRSDATVCGWVGLAIGGGGSASVSLTKTEAVYTTTDSTTQFAIPNSNYSTGAIVMVQNAGMLLTEGDEYTISNGNIVLSSAAPSGRSYTCIVISAS